MEPDAVANFVRGALQSGDFGTLVDQLEEAELHVRDLRFPSRPRRPTTAPRGEFRAQCIFIPDEPADALHAPADAPGSAPFALAQAAERSAVLSSDFCAALLMAHTLNGEACVGRAAGSGGPSSAARNSTDPSPLSTERSVDAKHCWKRIPREVKDRSHELRAVWTIGQHLLQEDTATADLGHVFLAMRVYEWSPLVAEMVAALAGALLYTLCPTPPPVLVLTVRRPIPRAASPAQPHHPRPRLRQDPRHHAGARHRAHAG